MTQPAAGLCAAKINDTRHQWVQAITAHSQHSQAPIFDCCHAECVTIVTSIGAQFRSGPSLDQQATSAVDAHLSLTGEDLRQHLASAHRASFLPGSEHTKMAGRHQEEHPFWASQPHPVYSGGVPAEITEDENAADPGGSPLGAWAATQRSRQASNDIRILASLADSIERARDALRDSGTRDLAAAAAELLTSAEAAGRGYVTVLRQQLAHTLGGLEERFAGSQQDSR